MVLVAVLAAGCGVRPSGVITGGPAPSAEAGGTVLYFLAGSAATPVLRPTGERLSPEQALALLQDGPTGAERAVELTSQVPAGLDPVGVRTDAAGGVEIVVSADVTTLSAAAVDQVVCTVQDALATDAPVTLTRGAGRREPRTCPRPAPGGPLSPPPR